MVISFSLFVIFIGEQEGVLDLMVSFNLGMEVLYGVFRNNAFVTFAFYIDLYLANIRRDWDH